MLFKMRIKIRKAVHSDTHFPSCAYTYIHTHDIQASLSSTLSGKENESALSIYKSSDITLAQDCFFMCIPALRSEKIPDCPRQKN